MHLILHYMKKHWKRITGGVSIKTLAALGELMIPYILEHIIDDVVLHQKGPHGLRLGPGHDRRRLSGAQP